MRPRTAWGWAVAVLTLTVALALAAQVLVALAQGTYLVDMVPGVDAGIATSPAFERAWADAVVLGMTLLALGAATGGVLLRRRGRAPVGPR